MLHLRITEFFFADDDWFAPEYRRVRSTDPFNIKPNLGKYLERDSMAEQLIVGLSFTKPLRVKGSSSLKDT